MSVVGFGLEVAAGWEQTRPGAVGRAGWTLGGSLPPARGLRAPALPSPPPEVSVSLAPPRPCFYGDRPSPGAGGGAGLSRGPRELPGVQGEGKVNGGRGPGAARIRLSGGWGRLGSGPARRRRGGRRPGQRRCGRALGLVEGAGLSRGMVVICKRHVCKCRAQLLLLLSWAWSSRARLLQLLLAHLLCPVSCFFCPCAWQVPAATRSQDTP